jgi:alpha-galactosidase
MTFAAWGVDFLKVDYCGSIPMGFRGNADATASAYGLFAGALTAAAALRPIELNVCTWGETAPWTWGAWMGATSWRTSSDLFFHANAEEGGPSGIQFSTVYRNFREALHPEAHGPGRYNDPDYLLIGGFGLSAEEERAYFSMWAMAAAPLMLATDLTRASQETLDIVGNREVIAIDQDPLLAQARLISSGGWGALTGNGGWEVWTKEMLPTADGKWVKAIMVLNRDAEWHNVEWDWDDLGYGCVTRVRDVWAHQDEVMYACSYGEAWVPPHGVRLFVVEGDD